VNQMKFIVDATGDEQACCHNTFHDVTVTSRLAKYFINSQILFKDFQLVFFQLQPLRIWCKFIVTRLNYER